MSRLKHALSDLEIGDVKTTQRLHAALVEDADVDAGTFDEGQLEHWLESNASRLV